MATLIEAIGCVSLQCAALPQLVDLRSSLMSRPLAPAIHELFSFLNDNPNAMVKEDYSRLREGIAEVVSQVIDAMLERATNTLGDAGFVWARPPRVGTSAPKPDNLASDF